MSDIKLFKLAGKVTKEIAAGAMALEKPLQDLFEKNLEQMLGVRFLDSEYAITNGRIDTLGLDENNCPVIIEYKRQSHENVINQGLFYLDWLAPRLICIAADFNKYDEHAVKQMNRNIELIRYRQFGDDLLMLDLLTATSARPAAPKSGGQTRQKSATESAGIIKLINAAQSGQKARYEALRDYLLSLGDDVQEQHLKRYVAFKRMRNFACVALRNQKNTLLIYANINPSSVPLEKGFTRDIRTLGNYPGNLEISISSAKDLERAKPLLLKAYEAS